MKKITTNKLKVEPAYEWVDKVKIKELPTIAQENKVMAEDMNYLKHQSDSYLDRINDMEALMKSTATTIDTEIKSLAKLIGDNGWIVGEYKWVAVGTPLIPGWEKVAMTAGQTIVSGTSVGTVPGTVAAGNVAVYGYNIPLSMVFSWSGGSGGHAMAGNGAGAFLSKTNALVFDAGDSASHSESVNGTSTTLSYGSGSLNLAAGIKAELWIYKGIVIPPSPFRGKIK